MLLVSPLQAERFTSSVLTFLSRAARCLEGVAIEPPGAAAAALCTALRCLESAAARESSAPLPDHQVPGTLDNHETEDI